jgi:hypothetical protein
MERSRRRHQRRASTRRTDHGRHDIVSRNEIRDATDHLADNLAAWMETLAADPDDLRSMTTPWLSRDGLTELRGILHARWKNTR